MKEKTILINFLNNKKLTEFRLPYLLKVSQTSKFINRFIPVLHTWFLQHSTAQHTKMRGLNYYVLSDELQAHICHKSKLQSRQVLQLISILWIFCSQRNE